MPRQNLVVDLSIPGKIRKRGCSSSASSTSSVIQNYRFKRAILVGKRVGSGTPVPAWRLVSSRSPASARFRTAGESPKHAPSHAAGAGAGGGEGAKVSAPVSARKLAATLWEMNEIPSPMVKEVSEERRLRKEMRARERLMMSSRSIHSGSLPPHLSDPSHSPVSEKMDRSGTRSRQRRTPSVSHRLRVTEHHAGKLDSLSNVSIMEIENRSKVHTQNVASAAGVKTRLKDVSNALTTSKELLKIINRIWGHEDRPSSSMSLISALHAELERARLQVNQAIQEQCSDQNEINFLMKCFAEEKAAWKSKEREVVEAAIESVVGELEVERKLRRRSESLNKKLGKELAETKSSLLKAVKEIETEKRAREIIEQVCRELARDIDEDKAQAEELKRDSLKACEEVEKEREMMKLADMLREERVQMKLSEAKHQLEEKNAAVDMLRDQLEAFFGTKKPKEKGNGYSHLIDEEIDAYLNGNHYVSHQKDDNGEVEDGGQCDEDLAESDLHSIELNMDNNNRTYHWPTSSGPAREMRRALIDQDETIERKSTSGKPPKKSNSLQRSSSEGVEFRVQNEKIQNSIDALAWDRLSELDRQLQGKGLGDEVQGYKSSKGLRDQILSGARLESPRVHSGLTRQCQWGQPWALRDPANAVQERPATAHIGGLKSRLMDVRGEGQIVRKSKR